MSTTRRTIAVNKKIHEEVKTLCKTLDLDLGEFVKQSMLYFKKTGINPGKSEHESPLKAIEELNKRVGQVVGFIKEHEQKKLNPLYDGLILLKNTLGDSLKILPKSERFDAVIKALNSIMDNHAKEKASLEQSRQEIMQENKTQIRTLTTAIDTLAEMVNGLKRQQNAMQETIDTKLAKKSKLNPFQSA
jgi:hypothetical protein